MNSFCGLPLGGKTYVMGILNVTPDSFSDGGLYFSAEAAFAHALGMIGDGADIIDIGAMSTRPGSEPVTPSEEIKRLGPVMRLFAEEGLTSRTMISADTVYPETAECMLSNGARIVNDVSGRYNPEIASLVKKYGAGYILTHAPVPAGAEKEYPYGVAADVNAFFVLCLRNAHRDGLGRSQICLDPGFGFGKNAEQNAELFRSLNLLKRENYALLAALSKKRFLGEDRDEATLVADVMADCDIVRVHDVKNTVRTLKIADRLRNRNG